MVILKSHHITRCLPFFMNNKKWEAVYCVLFSAKSHRSFVIADIQNGFVLWYIFFTDNGDFGSANEQNDAKRPLYHAQLADVGSLTVELADDPFDSEDGNSDDQIKNGKQQSKDGS